LLVLDREAETLGIKRHSASNISYLVTDAVNTPRLGRTDLSLQGARPLSLA